MRVQLSSYTVSDISNEFSNVTSSVNPKLFELPSDQSFII